MAVQRKAAEEEHDQLIREQAARREAELALRRRDEFLSVAAHELKTPMTSLRLATQLLLRQADLDVGIVVAKLDRGLQSIDDQASKLARLVTQLLETTRLDAGRLVLERQTENVTELVRKVVEQAQARTSRHEIVLSAPPCVLVSVDALRLEQVLTNLLDNAVKFSPQGGRIDVTVSVLTPGRVQLSVRDRGIGIPLEHRDGIFDRFYQAHTDSYRSGMGLGLYISRQIVELHGGRLEVGFPPDGGTCLVAHLPTG